MRFAALTLAFAVSAIAFQDTGPAPAKPKREKPTPREKARELLEGAVGVSASAQPDVQASALLYIGENYDAFDHKKALDYIRQGFAATAAIPPDSHDLRGELQSQIAGATAAMSLPDAAEMLRQIQPSPGDSGGHRDPRQSALQSVISRMLAKGQMDEATELLTIVGSTGQYPYRAAREIFEKLAPDDGRRITVFASAMAAYALRPGSGFSDLVGRHWKDIPQSMAESAVRAMVENILSRKDEGYTVQTMSSEKGSVDFSTQQDVELFDIMHVVQAIDPKRAERILEDRPALRAALEKFPEGRASLGDHVNSSSTSGSGKPDPAISRKQMLQGLASSRAAAAMKQLGDEAGAAAGKGDPLKAVALAKTIPVPARKAEALAIIARSVAARDAGIARSALSESIEILKEIKEPSDRIETWSAIVEAAHRIGDDKLAWEATDQGLADATELYKRDTDADAPNAALRDRWPSTNSYRRVVIAASKAFGVDAEPLLLRITDPDLALLARVEMAQALLGRPHESWSTSVSRTKK
ncbi:MAG: hypothetical protein M3Z36_05890 [Acidobacteriota bacterium]|nr:hypothetical protein [Acidobacteriota bacterium]